MITCKYLVKRFFDSFTYINIILDSSVEGNELNAVLKSLEGTGILLLAVSFWRQMMFKNI